MSAKKHIVIYSHGFGVRKDDLGLLTNIAEELNGVESILFDYFVVDESKKTLLVCSISSQAHKLNQIVSEAKASNPEAIIDLICHSQGTIVAAIVRPSGIRRVVMLAPVFDMGLERTLARYRSRIDAEINLDGISKLPSLDGLVRIIPKEYWQERLALKPFIEYNAFAQKTELIIIEALQDQLLPKVDLKELSPNIRLVSLDGDHNFNGSARSPLIKVIKKLLI
ncbi:MAG: alpha/beta hydrolase [Patescibacteria group bacterium]